MDRPYPAQPERRPAVRVRLPRRQRRPGGHYRGQSQPREDRGRALTARSGDETHAAGHMTDAPRSRLRSVLRWTPSVVLALVLLPSWGMFLSGGMAAVVGWSLLIDAGLLLAPLSLLVLVVDAIRKRRFSRPMWATLLFALVALWPGFWGLRLADRHGFRTVSRPRSRPPRFACHRTRGCASGGGATGSRRTTT